MQEKKRNGERVILTCGCFSVLHPGHLEYLKQCKLVANYLVVGINSDEYIEQYKKGIFHFSQEQRKMMLEELRSVDKVFIFHEKNFVNCLEIIKPDIFAKGTDYKSKIDPYEQRICDLNNIHVLILGKEKLYNSSDIADFYR
ncbi:MAG: adenylyltransferase/cytidyltransferase family protein [Mobilitalea sp.]